MELLFYSVLLYAWQCLVALPAAGWAFISRIGGAFRRIRGPGFTLLSPWPSSSTMAVGSYPLELGATSIYTESPRHFFGAGALTPETRSQPLASAEEWTARGSAVVYGSRSFFSTVSKAHAEHLADFFRNLAQATPEERSSLIGTELDAAFDVDACRRTFLEARRRTRALRWIASLYALVVFAGVPVLLIFRDAEAAWQAVLPALLVLHLAGVVALWQASRSLREATADRFERVFVGALYPPALLRAAIDLTQDRIARFHPAVIAPMALSSNDLQRFLRVERANYAHPSWQRHSLDSVPADSVPEEAERQAFLDELRIRVEAVARRLKVDLRPIRQDLTAASACPLCLFEYRPGFAQCASCGIATQPFPRDPY